MSTKIQVRRGTAAQWTSANPTLASGEVGFETDTGRFKIGTGALWGSTVYASTAVADTALLSAANVFAQGQTVSSTGNAILSLNSGVGGTAGNQVSGIDFLLNGTLKGNIDVFESTYSEALFLNSGTSNNVVLAFGGGNVGISVIPTVKLDVNGAVKATTFNNLTLTANTTGFSVAGGSLTSKTLQVNNTLTLAGTDSTTMTFPAASGTVVTKDSTDQLTNKTFASNTYSSATTLTTANDIVFISATVAWTLTLPTPTAGKVLHIVRTDATGVVITVAGHINNVASTTNSAWFAASSARKAILVSNGTTWYATSNGAF
jgi:hypothetical protein